jgi:hypothetical protein
VAGFKILGGVEQHDRRVDSPSTTRQKCASRSRARRCLQRTFAGQLVCVRLDDLLGDDCLAGSRGTGDQEMLGIFRGQSAVDGAKTVPTQPERGTRIRHPAFSLPLTPVPPALRIRYFGPSADFVADE